MGFDINLRRFIRPALPSLKRIGVDAFRFWYLCLFRRWSCFTNAPRSLILALPLIATTKIIAHPLSRPSVRWFIARKWFKQSRDCECTITSWRFSFFLDPGSWMGDEAWLECELQWFRMILWCNLSSGVKFNLHGISGFPGNYFGSNERFGWNILKRS